MTSKRAGVQLNSVPMGPKNSTLGSLYREHDSLSFDAPAL